ncbi:MAG: antibiotic biosynthesis monooxygenase [Acidimicrobiia bacterium]|nr:antibiotic biosynthesis monooxygenase [Acidimicrobiia bacterium]
MILTVFRNRLNPEHSAEYHDLSPRIAALADHMPGFISRKTFTADDGERVTVVEFADQESHQAWARHPGHREAMAKGRDRFYQYYDIKVCTVDRAWSYHADTRQAD